MLDQRGRLLRATLGFVTLRAAPWHPALDALHRWLDPGAAHSILDGTVWELMPVAVGSEGGVGAVFDDRRDNR